MLYTGDVFVHPLMMVRAYFSLAWLLLTFFRVMGYLVRNSIAMHQERTNKHANDDAVPDGAVPAYLLDREGVSRAKVLSNTVKQKRKEKAGKWDVPIPKVRASLV